MPEIETAKTEPAEALRFGPAGGEPVSSTDQTTSIVWEPRTPEELQKALDEESIDSHDLQERSRRHRPPQEWWDDESDPFTPDI